MKNRLLLNDDVALCCGRGCPPEYRNTCYRYQLHHFYDYVAKNTKDRPFFFVDPAVHTTANGKHHCNHHREILYTNRPR